MKSLISKVLNKIVFILIKLNIIKPKSIFYMGGVNILPPPLSAEEEMELLQQLETDDSIKQILIERNLRLVVYISRKFENTGIDIEDLISIGTIGLIKAVNTFKLNKNIKLATYASRCIENEILMYLRKNNKKKIEVSFDENDYFLRIENNKFLPTLENGKLVEKKFGDSFFIGNTKYYGFSAKYELFNCKDGESLSYQIGDEKYVAKTQINDEDILVIKQYMEKLSSQIDSLAYDDEKNYSSSSLNFRNR